MFTKVQGRMLGTIDWRPRKESIVLPPTQHPKVRIPCLHFWKTETSIGLFLVPHGWRSLCMSTLGERPTYFSPLFPLSHNTPIHTAHKIWTETALYYRNRGLNKLSALDEQYCRSIPKWSLRIIPSKRDSQHAYTALYPSICPWAPTKSLTW